MMGHSGAVGVVVLLSLSASTATAFVPSSSLFASRRSTNQVVSRLADKASGDDAKFIDFSAFDNGGGDPAKKAKKKTSLSPQEKNDDNDDLVLKNTNAQEGLYDATAADWSAMGVVDDASDDDADADGSKVKVEEGDSWDEDSSTATDPHRMIEFSVVDGPLPETVTRRERRAELEKIRTKFCPYGDELWDLRSSMTQLQKEYEASRAAPGPGSRATEASLWHTLESAQRRDPEYVYRVELQAARQAETDGRLEDATLHRKRAAEARLCLPQFHLEGLWIGKYGSHGYELINITYVGDTLFAFKVTGDNNVPRGELTFQANLSPVLGRDDGHDNRQRVVNQDADGSYVSRFHKASETLKPIVLTEKAARKWGTKQLPRYGGLGQVAEEGFVNHQWMEGQLILIGEAYFSFAWVPIGHQIFFGRPSPELALKMMREKTETLRHLAGTTLYPNPPSMEDHVQDQRDYVARCLDWTDQLHHDDVAEGKSPDPFCCIWHNDDAEECYFE